MYKFRKNAKKHLAYLLAVLFLLSVAVFPASAVELNGNMQIHSSVMNELSARLVVNSYFSQRLAFLNGTAIGIEVVNPAVFTDEQAHKAQLEKECVTIISSSVVINSINCWSNMATATVTETATFHKNGETVVETILHEITMSCGSNNAVLIQSDSYMENSSAFKSGSYVSPEELAAAELNATAGGSGMCITTIAYGQKDTAYEDGEDPKYRQWCQVTYGNTGNINDPWCAMFILWCAYHANVSTSVIPVYYGAATLKNHYNNNGQYSSKSGYTPKVGDLIFINYDQSQDEDSNPNTPQHVGLVRVVDAGGVWIVDGNWGNAVSYRYLPLTHTSILGYATPAYESQFHTTTAWNANALQHWRQCVNCGSDQSAKTGHTAASTWSYDVSYHWHKCSVCGQGQLSKSAHTIVQNVMTGWNYCSTCGFDGPPYN